MPTTTAASTSYPVYDASLAFNNSTSSAIGGMLAFIEATDSPAGDTVGPISSNLTLTDAGAGAYTLTADTDETTTGGATIAAAEYRVDSSGGTPIAMSAVDRLRRGDRAGHQRHGSHRHLRLDQRPAHDLRARPGLPRQLGCLLEHHDHPRHRRTGGQRPHAARPAPGPAPSLSPERPATATGNNNVVAAEYFVGITGADGSGTAMDLNQVAPTAAITATIAAGCPARSRSMPRMPPATGVDLRRSTSCSAATPPDPRRPA